MTKFNKLINSTEDGTGNFYNLYFEITNSSLPEYVDIRFYSTFSTANNPDGEQTKWMTTLPLHSIDLLNDTIIEFTREAMKAKL